MPSVAMSSNPSPARAAAIETTLGLSASLTEMNAVPELRQRAAGGALCLGERGRQVGGARHHLSGRAHLGAEHGIGAREAREREHRCLDAHLLRPRRRQVEVAQLLAGGELAGGLDEVDPDRLRGERHRARGPRVRLEDVDGRVGDRELEVEQPDHAERRREALDDVLDLERVRERERLRGQHAGRVAGVDAGLLDVLHHGGDVDVLAVAERVDVDLDRVLDEPVDEHGARDGGHRLAQLLVVVTDAHRAAAEHVRGADEHRIADLGRGGERLLGALDGRPRRAADAELVGEGAELLAVLGEVDRRRAACP